MKKHCTIVAIILIITSIAFIGCGKPKGDPKETLNSYYQNIKDSNYEGAYEALSKESKKNFSKKDFKKWNEVHQQLSNLNSFKISKTNEYKEKSIDDIKFKNVVEYNVTEKIQNLYDNKEETQNYKRNVVEDNGTWKVYRGKENGKQRIAKTLTGLAILYSDGKGGKSKDLNQAATLLNEALKYANNVAATYYELARTYTSLNRIDEALEPVNKFLQLTKDNKEKSDGYNLLGVIHESKNQKDLAKGDYTKALELNSNNQYAKTNLERVK